jgi:hypothetical protein
MFRIAMPRRLALAGAAAMTLASAASAQNVETLIVNKGRLHRQTDSSSASTVPVQYYIEMSVKGQDLVTIDPAPTVSGPISLGEPSHNGGVLGWNPDRGEWAYGFPNYNGWGVSTQTELDTLFGDGVYTFAGDTESVSVTLAGDAYPAEVPVLTLTGGQWTDAGVYLADARAKSFSVSTSTWSAFGDGLEDVVWIEVEGTSLRVDSFASLGDPPFAEVSVPGSMLPPGESFDIYSAFTTVTDVVAEIPGLPGAVAAAAWDREVIVTVQVCPLEDVDCDGIVGPTDLGSILAAWGPCKRGCAADIDGDGSVGPSDLGALLARWGSYL